MLFKTAQEKLDSITLALSQGCSVVLATHTNNQLKVTPKNAAKFKELGLEIFKVKGNSLYARWGSKFVCVDGCSITNVYKATVTT